MAPVPGPPPDRGSGPSGLPSLFLSAALESQEVARTVECLTSLIDAPVVLQDTGMLVLAAAGDGAERIALQPARCHYTREALRGMSKSHEIVRIEGSEGLPPRLMARVVGRDRLLGYLTVATAESRRAREALELAAQFAALILLSEHRVLEAVSLDRDEFFGDLIAGRSPSRLVTYGYKLGHDLRRPHVPVIFTLTPRQGRQPVLEDIVSQAVKEMRSHFAPAPVVGADEDGSVVVFLPIDDVAVARPFMENVTKRLRQHGLYALAGAGTRCLAVENYPSGLGKAKWVTEVLPALPGAPSSALFDDLGVFGLLFDTERSADIRQFMEKWLGPLIEYDRERKAELTNTLVTLLETDRQEDAASGLFIHPSTLKYRIRRIEEILGVDLKDRETQFNVRLAARIYSVYQLTGGLEGAGRPDGES